LAISSPSTTTIISGPLAIPNPGIALQPVVFLVTAINSTGAALTYSWAFGDGAQGTGISPSHSYASPGTYSAMVTITGGAAPVSSSVQVIVHSGVPVVGTGLDSDGDGFSDTFEILAGSAPGEPASTPSGMPITGTTLQFLTITKASIKLNFSKSATDAISFAGTLAIPANFKADGAKVILNAGGVTKTITLTAKGSGVNNSDSVKVAIKSKKGIVAAQTSKFTVSFKHGSFAATLAGAGLTNITVKGAPVMVPFTFIFNGGVLQTTQTMSYTSKMDKTAAAK
jgi:PKD repeat protein